ncbi:PAS domain-containing protein [Pedobacter frigiditerrae]|uniref:histidine kinase n=1 Tax=Pedobacter frigiditerrae TaxID=2530452 RepID=A0A4R0MMX8_9SPHI|nr:ATP-binding protein [Pedobacter frigiditerrae]TCC88080.1 PAS domain-containing protein [Pedobacter frigiditerrae]
MAEDPKTHEELLAELERLRFQERQQRETLTSLTNQLEEANDTLEAIRTGEVDALVINGADGHQVYTLKSADQTYRIFIEQMSQGAITINQSGTILYSNSQFASLISQPLEKVIGQSFYKYFMESDMALCKELVGSAWQDITTRGELRLKGNNGEVPVLLSLKTLNLDEGISLSIILTDLSEQKLSQRLLLKKNEELLIAEQLASQLNTNLERAVKARTQELYKSQQQLSRVLETMAEGVMIVDVNSRMTYANKMAQEFLGVNESEYQNKEYHNLKWQTYKLDGEPLKAEENPIYRAMKTGKAVYDFEIALQAQGRALFYVAVNAVPIFDEDKKLTGGIGTFVDVTHRRKAIQQKDDFISVASHELKTPITSLKAALQLLDRIKENPSTHLPKLIAQANRSMNKVSNLIEELLNASKITSGQMHLKAQLFKLTDLIEECLLNVNENFKSKLKIHGDLDLIVNGDPNRIEQVIVNFINNSIKYAPNATAIEILLEKNDNIAKVTVTDDGPGIHPDKLPHLFERYYRVDDGGAQYSGLGLGLYISAEIIKKHNGEIGAISELGKGSSFWFTLPIE